LKESSLFRLRRRDRKSAGHAGLACADFPFSVRRLLDVGISARCRHLSVGCLRIIAMLFICARICLRILEGNVFYHGKRIGMMSWREPRHLWLESSRVHRQGAVENASRDRSGDGSAMLAALNHCHNNVFWVIEWCKAAEPGNGIFLAVGRSLGGAGFAGNFYALQTRPPTCAAILINDFPKSAPHHLDLFR